jgi:hypothetical protein
VSTSKNYCEESYEGIKTNVKTNIDILEQKRKYIIDQAKNLSSKDSMATILNIPQNT